MNKIIFSILIWLILSVQAIGYENGTLLFSKTNLLPGRIAAKFIAPGNFQHVGIIFDGYVYESVWPRAKRSTVKRAMLPGWSYWAIEPVTPYTTKELRQMRQEACDNLGKPYRVKNFLWPRTKETYGTWCSQYVREVLNASGRYQFTWNHGWEPQGLYNPLMNKCKCKRCNVPKYRKINNLWRFKNVD